MARQNNRLSAIAVTKAKTPGQYPDGGGLYLNVSTAGTKSWIFRFMLRGRAREMGLGSVSTVNLGEARGKAADAHRLRAAGIDPIENRIAKRKASDLVAARAISFDDCADAYIEAHRPSWRNPKHATQWTATLETYVRPVLGRLSVAEVDTPTVMKVLDPIWNVKPETASRIRGRIESVLAWATVRGYRAGANPAQWKNHLDQLLPARGKIRKVVHHAALPYSELVVFLADLRSQSGVSPAALEFLILTAARTGEVLGARWNEIDIGSKIWTIPADRMKGGREHKVPLSAAAMAVLDRMKQLNTEYVFSGRKRGKSLSNMALLAVLRRMEPPNLTSHGFRSTFRDWAAERTNFAREVAETALAHSIGDKVEAAYRRGDLFEKRRRLMDAWADFATKQPLKSQVLPLKQTG
jgi:integrase